jgi:hypothetical protein
MLKRLFNQRPNITWYDSEELRRAYYDYISAYKEQETSPSDNIFNGQARGVEVPSNSKLSQEEWDRAWTDSDGLYHYASAESAKRAIEDPEGDSLRIFRESWLDRILLRKANEEHIADSGQHGKESKVSETS